jgi:hypothetical protein
VGRWRVIGACSRRWGHESALARTLPARIRQSNPAASQSGTRGDSGRDESAEQRFLGTVQKRVTAQGGWGRRPAGDAPRSEASALGLAGYCQLDPSHPAIVTCEGSDFEPCPSLFASGLRRKRTASTTAASWEFTGKHKLTSQTPYLSRTNVRGQGFRQGFRGQGFSLWCEWIVQTLGLESTVRPRGRPRQTAP